MYKIEKLDQYRSYTAKLIKFILCPSYRYPDVMIHENKKQRNLIKTTKSYQNHSARDSLKVNCYAKQLIDNADSLQILPAQ